MAGPKSPIDMRQPDRRTGFNRRWIKSQYSGQERRKVKDRREGMPAKDLLVPEDLNSKKMVGFEKLMVSTTIQLEAVTRLLLEKGIIEEKELLEMMNQVQKEYHENSKA
jgi:hypothetical protein